MSVLADRRLAPSSVAGQMSLWLGLASVVAFLGVATQSAESAVESCAYALVLTLPVVVLAARGHFGHEHWRIPSVGGFVFAFWQLGLAPSMCAIPPDANRVCQFDDEAVFWGLFIHFLWFLLFAFAVGRAAPDHEARKPEEMASGLHATQLYLVVIAWGLGALAASKTNALSLWRGTRVRYDDDWLTPLALLYAALTPVLPPLGRLVGEIGGPFVKRSSALLSALGVFFLFVLSSRRQWVVAAFLYLAVVQASRRKAPKALVALVALTTLVSMGPLLWSFRATASDHRAGGPFERVMSAVVATLEEGSSTRARALDDAQKNLTVRLNISTITYGAVQLVIDRGPRLEGTMFSGLVRTIPKVLWKEKNRIADAMDARMQMLRTGRFPVTDIPITPITELTYDWGLFLAPAGGLLYGGVSRLACARARSRRCMVSSPGRPLSGP